MSGGQDWNGGAQEWIDNPTTSNDIGANVSNGIAADEFGDPSMAAPEAVEGGGGDDTCRRCGETGVRCFSNLHGRLS